MFVCFLHTRTSSVPHLEFLAVETVVEAHNEALVRMLQHEDVTRAQIYNGDELLATIPNP